MKKKVSQSSAPESQRQQENGRLRLESDYLVESSLAETLDSFVEPAFLLNERGDVLFTNAAAKRGAPIKPPIWLRVIPQISDRSNLEGLALINEVKFRGRTLFLVQPKEGVSPNDEDLRVLKLLNRLSNEFQIVAELMFMGLSDRNIACCTELEREAIETQASQIYEQLGVKNRQELIDLKLRKQRPSRP